MARIAVSRDPSAVYPEPEGFGPPEVYPEIDGRGHHGHGANRAFALVRRALAEYGCDVERFGTPEWNPLRHWIRPGARVFVLPNLVMHRRSWEPRPQFQAQCTHASVLRAVIDYALLAAGPTGSVAFGSAPVHGSDFASSAEEAGSTALGEYYRVRGLPVRGPLDLRDEPGTSAVYSVGCRIDLGADSLLDEHWQRDGAPPNYRVGTYDPGWTATFHGPGRHVYLVDRRVLEADVVISVPKLKMHSKVGLTCALKGTVGTVTNKGCLAHFRAGAPEEAGDEFPAATAPARLASRLNEAAAHAGEEPRSALLRLATRVGVRIARSFPSGVVGGNWPGNDTCWRMALDLSRILLYGNPDGTMRETPAREHLVLIDGIVAGEGEGPLHATPRRAGLVLFGADACAADAAASYLMGLDPRAVPLVNEAFAPHRYPLTRDPLDRLDAILDGSPRAARTLSTLLDPAPRTARGWESCRIHSE